MENLNEINTLDTNYQNHRITIDSRNSTVITGITNVESASENGLTLHINNVVLSIEGDKLKVQKIDVDTGIVEVSGLIKSLKYSDSKPHRSILKKLTNKQ